MIPIGWTSRVETSTPALRTAGLSKRYGGTPALDRLDLVVQPGEMYGYSGRHGGPQDHDDPSATPG